MSTENCILVCGIDETASAVARRLFLQGYAVAIQQERPPDILRRATTFADAWFDGFSTLEGVDARRARNGAEFLGTLRSGQFIPILRQPFVHAAERWPWDAIVATRASGAPARLLSLAETTVGLGEGFVAGLDCDFVVEVEGPDPGAIVRAGPAPERRRAPARADKFSRREIPAVGSGVFRTGKAIGETVQQGEILGAVGGAILRAPVDGRIDGLARNGRSVEHGVTVAEIVDANAPTVGVPRRAELVARGVAFALEMEFEGWAPAPFEEWGR
jgi:xanthine dehydrogenase accessory factor